MAKGKVNTIMIFIGALCGFVAALLLEWMADNLIINIANAFDLIVIIYLILVFVFLILGLYLLYIGHVTSGAFFLVLALKLLNWILQWYLPLYYDGDWFNFNQFWF